MYDTNEQNPSSSKKPMNPIVTGVTGVIVGAGLGAAATKIFTDKKMRGKIMDTVSSVSHNISVSVGKAREKAMEMRESMESKPEVRKSEGRKRLIH